MAWIWFCGYDKGYGVDREVCFGRSRKPLASKERAIAGARRHANHPGYHFGKYSHTGEVFVEEVTPTGRKKKNGEFFKVF